MDTNSKREANWVVFLGYSGRGDKIFLSNPNTQGVTLELDQAWGWHYKKAAQSECAAQTGSPDRRVGRRSEFR
jgi:hypothetical protein